MDIKSLSKKISYHNIRYKLKRLIFKMGENDFYPQLPKSKYSFLTNYQRYKFWNSLARKHKQFKYFYQKNPGEYFEKYLPISKNHKYYVNFKKFYEDGVAEIENFFNNEEHQLILNFFKSNTIKNLESVKKQNVICKDENINQLIFNKTKILEKILFGKYFKKQNYNFQSILKNKNESSIFGTSANFHPDRFIPSIKLIYFPTDVKIDPFEYALGSHIINENFEQNILIEFENEKKIGKLIREQIKLNRETGQNMDPKLLDKPKSI